MKRSLLSLGRRTDLMFTRQAGEVIERDEYVVVRTPANPGYHWGNYLIYRNAPPMGALKHWHNDFEREFGTSPSHRLFAWDITERGAIGYAQEFTDRGMRLETATVLTAPSVNPPPRRNTDIQVRQIATEDEWLEVIEQWMLARPPEHAEAGYRLFTEGQIHSYRELSKSGMGHWYGAFHSGRLVGDLGIFHEAGVARYQSVSTQPEFRRRGICGTLVYQAAALLSAEAPIDTFVMEADPEYHAARIYESVGFEPCESNHSLYWHVGMTAPLCTLTD